MPDPALELTLSPHGHLYVATPASSRIATAFQTSPAAGLLALAAARGPLPAQLAWWRTFADAFLHDLARAGAGDFPDDLSFPPQLGVDCALRIPAMPGAEYATPDVFANLWRELLDHARDASKADGLRAWLAHINPALHTLGRVTFHLAENKRTPETPFAFMATYTHRLSGNDKSAHLPLARALQEYAGSSNQQTLRALLEPVNLAAERSALARELLDSRDIFQPLAWDANEALVFLREVALLEQCGIVTRIPNWWKNGKGPRPRVSARIGDKKGSQLNADSLLSFSIQATLDGEKLSDAEWQSLMRSDSGLVSLRGQWVEVDREKLASLLAHWKKVERGELGDGVDFLGAMRMLSGVRLDADPQAEGESAIADWSEVSAGDALRTLLDQLGSPENAATFDPNERLNATLRPYQAKGVKWLWFMQRLGLGACLADDMGLGKTIQVIALLLRLKHEQPGAPSLLVAPASLLANWKSELARFAPDLSVGILHPSESPAEDWRDAARGAAFCADKDVLLTTYGQTTRLEWLSKHNWRLLVLDEAQAIKNTATKQTRAVKALSAGARIALSGTPVENRLGDLWSLYDFLNPGLLGSTTDFARYVKRLQDAAAPNFAPLRKLTQPYLLRRLKSDKTIIVDLPDKTELRAWCGLSKRQAALYQHAVGEMRKKIEGSDGIERRGLVLAFLMRFKQICNHPSHWLGDGEFDPAGSGKFERLRELCEEIASRGEKALVFTQFREMTAPIAGFLEGVFGRAGLVLHGSVAVKERQKLVTSFQRDDGPPFFVLSLKAGGSGLTLTAASHVIHFDRWWNPAVENQATDRAYRIGQKRNVLVHKFVCRGTIEERIDALIDDKRALA